MDRAQLCAICLAFGVAVTAGSASAKDGTARASTWDRFVLSPKVLPRHTAGLPPDVPIPSRTEPSHTQFLPSVQLAPSLMFQKTKTIKRAFEMGSFNALFEASRSKTEQSDGLSYFARPRVASLQTRAALLSDITSSDALAMTASFTRERRRPAIMIAQRKNVSSNDRSFSLGWTHDDTFQLAISAYDVRPSRNSGSATRIVELASGAPRAATGVGFSLSLAPTGNSQEMSLSLNVTQKRAELPSLNDNRRRVNESASAVSVRYAF